jgi:hypothetical protein
MPNRNRLSYTLISHLETLVLRVSYPRYILASSCSKLATTIAVPVRYPTKEGDLVSRTVARIADILVEF